MGYKVGLTEAARNDLGAAVRFIAIDGRNPDAALRLGNELLDAALSLALFPRRGSPVRRRPGMRKLSHRYWLIFYQVNEAPIGSRSCASGMGAKTPRRFVCRKRTSRVGKRRSFTQALPAPA